MEHSIDTIRAKLFASVLSDTLDGLGYRNQAMRPSIRPLDEAKGLVGRACIPAYFMREWRKIRRGT